MSKTSDENSIVAATRAYWKQFAALVTGFARRYQSDLFLRTEVNIIVLQTLYALLILALAIGSIVFLYQEVVGGVVGAVSTILAASSTPLSATKVLSQLHAARTRDVVSITVLVTLAAIVFGYLIARLALRPTRNALAAQKQFIGNIAHELRTPLAIIKTNTEVLMLEEKIDKNIRTTFESNIEELDRISDIINNLLTLNSFIRPEQITFAAVDMGVVVHRVVDKLAPAARKKPIHLKLKLARSSIAWGNATALEQITSNILKNAIQHTSRGEIIVSTGNDSKGCFELTVQDTGSGIKREHLFRIFEPFYRGDRARTRTGGGGSGLGLAIVSELVRLHHGRVSVKSTSGQGTTVLVTLPRAKDGSVTPSGDSANEVFADFSSSRPA